MSCPEIACHIKSIQDGIYICKLDALNSTKAIKMTLLR